MPPSPSGPPAPTRNVIVIKRPARARSYLGRLLMLVPSGVMLAVGWWHLANVPPGGTVSAVKLTVKPGPVGQVREAYDSLRPTNPDLYLRLIVPGREVTTRTRANTPIGNGLTWNLDDPFSLADVRRVEVWDDGLFSDSQLDNISLSGAEWSATGQTFQIDLHGTRPAPPDWALPLATAGGTLCAVVLLRFVWDQVL
jgi:hypothetical protein